MTRNNRAHCIISLITEALSIDTDSVYQPYQAEPPLEKLLQKMQSPEQADNVEQQALQAARKGTYGVLKGVNTPPPAGRPGMTSTDAGGSAAGTGVGM